MTLVNTIEAITEWCQTAICDGLKLKLPDDDLNDGEFPGETVTPTAFPLYVPAKDRLPPKAKAPIPSICVQLKEGQDLLKDGRRELKIRLSLAAWNPGLHGSEIKEPAPHDTALGGVSYHSVTDEEAVMRYNRNMDGWRDIWNFTDKALRALEGTEYIAGLRLIKEGDGIKYGHFTEDGAIWDYYPYWFMWLDFTLECGVVHKIPKSYEKYL